MSIVQISERWAPEEVLSLLSTLLDFSNFLYWTRTNFIISREVLNGNSNVYLIDLWWEIRWVGLWNILSLVPGVSLAFSIIFTQFNHSSQICLKMIFDLKQNTLCFSQWRFITMEDIQKVLWAVKATAKELYLKWFEPWARHWSWGLNLRWPSTPKRLSGHTGCGLFV